MSENLGQMTVDPWVTVSEPSHYRNRREGFVCSKGSHRTHFLKNLKQWVSSDTSISIPQSPHLCSGNHHIYLTNSFWKLKKLYLFWAQHDPGQVTDYLDKSLREQWEQQIQLGDPTAGIPGAVFPMWEHRSPGHAVLTDVGCQIHSIDWIKTPKQRNTF